MPFIINGVPIKSKEDYLSKGDRSRINSSMRKDLFEDYSNLMKHINRPMSIGYDVFIEMLLEDEQLLNDFINKVKLY